MRLLQRTPSSSVGPGEGVNNHCAPAPIQTPSLLRRYTVSLQSLAQEEAALRRVDPVPRGAGSPRTGTTTGGARPGDDGVEPAGRMVLAEMALCCRGAVRGGGSPAWMGPGYHSDSVVRYGTQVGTSGRNTEHVGRRRCSEVGTSRHLPGGKVQGGLLCNSSVEGHRLVPGARTFIQY